MLAPVKRPNGFRLKAIKRVTCVILYDIYQFVNINKYYQIVEYACKIRFRVI